MLSRKPVRLTISRPVQLLLAWGLTALVLLKAPPARSMALQAPVQHRRPRPRSSRLQRLTTGELAFSYDCFSTESPKPAFRQRASDIIYYPSFVTLRKANAGQSL